MRTDLNTASIVISERPLTEETLATLIRYSRDWEEENSCHGYRKNDRSDIEGNRVFLAENDEQITGYLFGHMATNEKAISIMPAGTRFFEVEELYVCPPFRGHGIGQRLFRCAEQAVSAEADFLMLSTATKNWRAIMHFYIDELDMQFWSARLFKRLPQANA